MKNKPFIADHVNRVIEELKDEVEGIVGKETLEGYKQFAFKDNLIQMSMAFMLGAAFKSVATGISNFLIMPIINYISTYTGEDWRDKQWIPVDGLIFEVGQFTAVFIDFILISIVLYIMWAKFLSPVFDRNNRRKNPRKNKQDIKCIETIKCPKCISEIHFEAKRCPFCTSELKI